MGAFYKPGDFGFFDIASTQIETVPITFGEAISANPEIVFISNNRVIKTLTEGSGITVATNRLSLVYVISGVDFVQYDNVRTECKFYDTGVVEFVFRLKTIRTFITAAT